MRNQTLIVNSETILRASLALDNVPAKFLTPEELPFLVSRRRGDGSMCFADTFAKIGPNFNCIPTPARDLLKKYRCSGTAGLEDTDNSFSNTAGAVEHLI